MCQFDGCDRPQEARVYCNKHYLRLLRNGGLAKDDAAEAERYWQWVKKELNLERA